MNHYSSKSFFRATKLTLFIAITSLLTGLGVFLLFHQEPGLGATAIPAFPGAEGAGALTPGGRGGRIIEVTNLNNSGPGSLRAAIDTEGPRIVVFRVSGIIELKQPLWLDNSYLTIAGQTAPGGGITLKGTDEGGGKMIVIRNVHDVIIRYLRIRSGAHGIAPNHGQTNIAVDSGSHDIIIDHSSFSWTLDENVSIHRNIPENVDPASWPHTFNVTLQRSMMAEGLWPHSTGTQIGGESETGGWRGVYNISVHHNLYVNNTHRNPAVSSVGAQVVNNVMYNWFIRIGSTWRDSKVDWINNYFKPGPFSIFDTLLAHQSFPQGQPGTPWPPPSIYIAGNVAPPNYPDPNADNWQMYSDEQTGGPIPETFRRNNPLPQVPISLTIQSVYEAYDSVLADVGANARLDCNGNLITNSDSVDQRLLSNVRSGTVSVGTPIVHEDQVGGYPSIAVGIPCVDSDHDGMPNEWETATGVLNPQVNDSAGYDLDNDYTNVEVYLNGLKSTGAPAHNELYLPLVIKSNL